MANALARAVKKLDPEAEDPTRSIIQTQLFGQDINPMATQITRLRLFIAIMAAESGMSKLKPLPNLEGRIVCADTLANVASPDWSFETALGLTGADRNISETLRERWGVMQMWADAHSEEEKEWVLQQDETTRMRLQDVLQETGNEDHVELMSFAKHELLAVDAKPVATDSRLIFYDENRQGFDIVIGNPPYETIAKDRSYADRRTVKNNLRDRKQYVTTRGNNLYNLFCEVALALAKPNGGVVTLIVPLSLAFAQAQTPTRRLFERRSTQIWLRHQDNRPDKTFHDSPVASPESRQRTTILTAITGDAKVSICTTGVSKWSKSEREQFLINREYSAIPKTSPNMDAKLANQWPRIPSDEIRALTESMMSQARTFHSLMARASRRFSVGLPNSAYEFLTVAPAGKLRRRELLLDLETQEHLELAMAAMNCHIAYAWWRIWGNTFTIRPGEFTSLPVPDQWFEDNAKNQRARYLGRCLVDAINPRSIRHNVSGTASRVFENVNFHETCPEIVKEIDMLYLDALDLLDDRLLDQLRKLRSNSNWRFA